MRRLFLFAAALALPAAILGACTTNSLTPKGGACFQMIDCAEGLTCKYVNDAGTCTDDLTGLNTLPPEAGADVPAQLDAPVVDAPADQVVKDTAPPQDTGTQDTSTPDTGTQDTGASDAPTG